LRQRSGWRLFRTAGACCSDADEVRKTLNSLGCGVPDEGIVSLSAAMSSS
jgi:hypothetical protein